MSTRIAMLLLLFFVGTTGALAQQQGKSTRHAAGEISLSNDTLDLRYIGKGGLFGTEGNTQTSGAFFLSEDRDIVLSGAMLFRGPDIDRLTLQFGPQVYAALLNEENNDVLSIAIGLQARYVLDKSSGFAVSGRAFYGPDILTFGSADKIHDLSARVEIQAAPRLLAFAGMRWFEFDLTEGGGTQTLQDEIFVGLGYRF